MIDELRLPFLIFLIAGTLLVTFYLASHFPNPQTKEQRWWSRCFRTTSPCSGKQMSDEKKSEKNDQSLRHYLSMSSEDFEKLKKATIPPYIRSSLQGEVQFRMGSNHLTTFLPHTPNLDLKLGETWETWDLENEEIDKEENRIKNTFLHLAELIVGQLEVDVSDIHDGSISAAPIYLTPKQIREVLDLYFDIKAEEMEKKIDKSLDDQKKEVEDLQQMYEQGLVTGPIPFRAARRKMTASFSPKLKFK